MACKSCTPDTPVLEANPLGSGDCGTCSTCQLPSNACGCPSSISPCQEDHTTTIVKKRYAYTLRATEGLTWPAPDESVIFKVDSVERLSIGSLIYNPAAGYLHVTNFDCVEQKVTAENQGELCNTYEGGEMLPTCSDFIVGPPPCNPNTPIIPGIPYLAADFISPAEGDCALASVTTIQGLTVNDIISINGYQYSLADIPDSDTIQLCNDGDGAPVGTVIYWDEDGDGVPNIPVIVVSSENPCDRDGVSAGVLLVCEAGNAKPLVGSVGGQIPVWNNITERYELKNFNAPYTVCTSLTADLIVDPVHVGSYLILVTDTSDFAVNAIVIIDGKYYVVDSVDDATTMHVTPIITPPAIHTYPAGTPVCLDLEPNRSDIQKVVSATASGTIADNTTLSTVAITLTINNTSPSKVMKVMARHWWLAIHDVQDNQLNARIQENIDGGAYADIFAVSTLFLGTAGASSIGRQYQESTIHTINPGDSLVIGSKALLSNAVGGDDCACTFLTATLDIMAITA